MDRSGTQRFHRSPPIRVLMSGISLIGLVVLVYAFVRSTSGPSIEFMIGFLLFAFGLQEVVRPVFVTGAEGLMLARRGLKGMGVLIRWASIRHVELARPGELVIGLNDRSRARLMMWSLSDADRERLVSIVGERSVMADERIPPAAGMLER